MALHWIPLIFLFNSPQNWQNVIFISDWNQSKPSFLLVFSHTNNEYNIYFIHNDLRSNSKLHLIRYDSVRFISCAYLSNAWAYVCWCYVHRYDCILFLFHLNKWVCVICCFFLFFFLYASLFHYYFPYFNSFLYIILLMNIAIAEKMYAKHCTYCDIDSVCRHTSMHVYVCIDITHIKPIADWVWSMLLSLSLSLVRYITWNHILYVYIYYLLYLLSLCALRFFCFSHFLYLSHLVAVFFFLSCSVSRCLCHSGCCIHSASRRCHSK